MVNASLNWASIVGIVLAVCGGGLYFLRSFKPALARDYDVFFAAIGLLCGGILFFQGWRLDPILQFGQFLLAGTTVFFAYESVRLRGIATDQARRSAFFEDDQIPDSPRNAARSGWDDRYDQFDQTERVSRRFRSRDLEEEEDYQDDRYSPRRVSRAIPESAASRRRPNPRGVSNKYEAQNLDSRNRIENDRRDFDSRRSNFGDRRNTRSEIKRGSRPSPSQNTSRQSSSDRLNKSSNNSQNQRFRTSVRSQKAKSKVEDASFTPKNNDLSQERKESRRASSQKTNIKNQNGRYSVGSKREKPRDNSSRFDD